MKGPEIPCSAVFLDGSDVVVDPSVGNDAALMRNFEFFYQSSQRHSEHRSMIMRDNVGEEVEDLLTD